MNSQRPPTPYPIFRRKVSAPEKKQDDIAQYCKEMLQKSMLTGVPQIVSAPTTRSKVFKTVVLLGSVTGFLYQTSAYLVMYFAYPTLVDVQVTTPPYVDVPAITICNRNGFRRKDYCELKPENCEEKQDIGNFCEHYSEACINGSLKGGNLFPKNELILEEASATQELIKKAGHPSYPLISDCRFEVVNVSFDFCKNTTFQSFIFKDLNGKMKKCHILNARWNMASLNLPQVPTRAELKITLDLEPDQSFRLNREIAGQIAVHSPWNILNPFTEGMTVKPRRTYIIRFKEDIKNLLPWPYQTNCTDYIKKWEIRGGNGPLSKDLCIEECILNQTMDNCNCVLTNNLYPHKFRFCGAETDLCTAKINFTHCFVKCSPACQQDSRPRTVATQKHIVEEYRHVQCIQKKYTDAFDSSRNFEITVQEEDSFLGSDEGIMETHNWNRTVALLFLFKKTQVNIYRYRAKYETIEFFSFMGGFIGIWLGVSLIALFDFLESLSTFAVFLFDRMKNSNQVSELRSAIGSRIRSRSNSTFSTDSMPWAKSTQNPNNLMVNSVRRIIRTP